MFIQAVKYITFYDSLYMYAHIYPDTVLYVDTFKLYMRHISCISTYMLIYEPEFDIFAAHILHVLAIYVPIFPYILLV